MSTYEIFIKDLTLQMSIGVLPEEREAPQRVIVNICADSTYTGDWKEDDVANVVSYADMIEKITLLSRIKHFTLAETFAEEIAALCLETFPPLHKISVSVDKPDIVPETQTVGIRIERRR
jgi:dihydroneopterin aldolase